MQKKKKSNNIQQIFYGWSILNSQGDSLIEVSKKLKQLKRSKDRVANIYSFQYLNSALQENLLLQFRH